MHTYIDKNEKSVARLGGAYAPGVKRAPTALELTDKRLYFSAASAPTKQEKTVHYVSSVIDAGDVAGMSYTFDKPRGSCKLGGFLLVISIIAGIALAIMQFVKANTGLGMDAEHMGKIIAAAAAGVGIGVFLLIACYVVTYFMSKRKRPVTVSVEYSGIILKAEFFGLSDEKLDTFRENLFKVKERLNGKAEWNVFAPNAKTDTPVEETPQTATAQAEVFDDRPIERNPITVQRKKKMKETIDVGDL